MNIEFFINNLNIRAKAYFTNIADINHDHRLVLIIDQS